MGRPASSVSGHAIRTSRLLLRPLSPDDRSFLRSLFSSPEIYPALWDGKAPAPEFADRLVDESRRTFTAHALGIWIVGTHDAGEPAGIVGLRLLAGSGMFESVFAVTIPYRGRGFATECVRATVLHAFTAGRQREVRASTRKDNSAGGAVLRRSGFSLIGEEVQPFAILDVYAIRRPTDIRP